MDEESHDASSAAMTELAELIAAIEVDSHHPRWNFTTLQDRASYDNEPQLGCGAMFLLCILALAAAIGLGLS